MQDFEGVKKALGKESYGIALAYLTKFVAQFGSATFSLLASLSYAAPLLEASSNKTVQWMGARLLFYRLVSMTWVVRLNAVGLAVTVMIWVFVPHPLKQWCEECPFGLKKYKGTRNPKILMENLGSALEAIS